MSSSTWVLIGESIYILFIVLVCLQIIYNTRSTTKTAAYILLVIFIPLIGVFIYLSFGINYRKKKIYSKSLFSEEDRARLISAFRPQQENLLKNSNYSYKKYNALAKLIYNNSYSSVSGNNQIEVLLNGEHKFPAVFKALKKAQHHIHIEYYIFELDDIGNRLITLLAQKVTEGVKVRLIYDDFGSFGIKRKDLKKIRAMGIEAFPFYKIKLLYLANRMNYRNHRKIIVIDGQVGFVGGINISKKYNNVAAFKNKLYWRDTHLKIEGEAVKSLQYIFMGDWNYCANQKLKPSFTYFPKAFKEAECFTQIVASGPDSDTPLIMQSICKAISLAQKEILITTPYFIPDLTVKDILIMTAQSGVNIKLLVPRKSDSHVVDWASRANFAPLINAGVEIYRYEKGFIHAKTMVIDEEIAIVGTANMDMRSFDLNFEVNAMVYDTQIAKILKKSFEADLRSAVKIDKTVWNKRPAYKQLWDKTVSLISPLM